MATLPPLRAGHDLKRNLLQHNYIRVGHMVRSALAGWHVGCPTQSPTRAAPFHISVAVRTVVTTRHFPTQAILVTLGVRTALHHIPSDGAVSSSERDGTSATEPSATLRIERLQTGAAEWDAYVRASAKGTFCHLSGWREVMSGALGHDCHFLLARAESGEYQGVLPLVHVRSRLFGDFLLSMPFLNYGGAIGTPAAEESLCRYARTLAHDLGVQLLELRNRHRATADLECAPRKVTVLLPLPAAAEVLMAGFPAKLRSQIRRPMKEGMDVRFGAEIRHDFYTVLAHHMRDLGTPVLPRQFFDAIARVFPREAIFGAVYHRGQPVAAGCGFSCGDEFELTWASALRDHNRRAPNMLLYWGLMQHAIEQGVRVFNFGRCTPDGSTHRFKLQWGGDTMTLPWLQWSSTGITAPPTPDRPLYRVATRIWSRLPLALANSLGPVLARSLP